jgi:hypothetical protein
MKRLGAVLLFLMLLVLACGNTDNTQTPLHSALEATAQAQDAAPETSGQPDPNIDIESTITFRVQATVRALLSATPIPSPTPTRSAVIPTRTPEPTSYTTQTGGAFNTAPAPTPTRVATSTTAPGSTPLPTRSAGCVAAADGVRVSAWVGGIKAGSAVVSSGEYSLLAEQPSNASFFGKAVTFMVGNSNAAQTIPWQQGAATELALTAPGDGLSRHAPEQIDTASPNGSPLAQPLLPHVILGSVFVGNC